MIPVLFGSHEDFNEKVAKRLDGSRFDAEYLSDGDPKRPFDGFDCFVPQRFEDYGYPASVGASGAGTSLCPDPAHVALADDKLAFNRYLIGAGFGAFVPEMDDRVEGYPYIYKKRIDEWGKASSIIRTPEEERALEQTIVREDYFKQALVPGQGEFTTHIIAAAGTVVYDHTVHFAFDREIYVKGRQCSADRETDTGSPCLLILKNIIRQLGFTGACCFNYKMRGGQPMLFEMNPRFGSSVTRDINRFLEHYLKAVEARRQSSLGTTG